MPAGAVHMNYLVTCRCSGHVDSLHKATRADHLQFIIAHRAEIGFGGALYSDGNGEFAGMIVVLNVASREEALKFVENEPYCRAGMFTTIDICPLAIRIPEPSSGFLHEELERERRSRRNQSGT
jgi:hypothetical protein